MHNIHTVYCRNSVSSMLVCYSKHNGSVFCCILNIFVNVVGYFGISCIQTPFMHIIHTAYCRNCVSSMLVCYSKHNGSVFCCILNIFVNVVGYLGISCIQTPFMHIIHTAYCINCVSSMLVCYSKHNGSVFCCILHILLNAVGYLGISCMQTPFMHNMTYCINCVSSMLVCYSKQCQCVLLYTTHLAKYSRLFWYFILVVFWLFWYFIFILVFFFAYYTFWQIK